MEAFHDGRGLALTAANPQAIEAFEHALEALLGAQGGVDRRLAEALRRDPHFVLARCMRIAVRLLHGDVEAATRDAGLFGDELPAYASDRERNVERQDVERIAGEQLVVMAARLATVAGEPRLQRVDVAALAIAGVRGQFVAE